MGYCVGSYCGPDGGAGRADIKSDVGMVADSPVGGMDVADTE